MARFPLLFRDVVLSRCMRGRYRKLSTASLQLKPFCFTDENQAVALEKCQALQETLKELNHQMNGPLKSVDDLTKFPFVFLLGNHSSGKSSFINYVLNRPVQQAGVAPTDDSFTIIAPGNFDYDQDGPALVGDPDLGFRGLNAFGPRLVHHLMLKIRSDIDVENFMLVDSPGMIDSPLVKSAGASFGTERGYDFQRVVKWFAERADVILLFFDPDKPGTTGETLSVLTNSLKDSHHKLLIILNKADKFRKIHDFARAYGSLCWNLSKVIDRKDLPRIFTMCLPVDHRQGHEISSSGLSDLEHTREDVVKEAKRAPKRRVDNLITRLTDSAYTLHMFGRVIETVRRRYKRLQYLHYGGALTMLVAGGSGASAAMLLLEAQNLFVSGTIMGSSALLSLALYLQGRSALMAKRIESESDDYLDAVFYDCFRSELSDGNEYYTSLWNRIRAELKKTIKSVGLDNLPYITSQQQTKLARILNHELNELRRSAAPYYQSQGTESSTKNDSP